MPINPLPHATALPPSEFSVTNTAPSDNAQTSNPPVSENPAAFPSPSHQHGGAAFRQQALLLENAKLSTEEDPDEFCRRFDAKAFKSEKSRIELAWVVVNKSPECLAENIKKFDIPSQMEKIALAKIVAEKEPYEISVHIQDFEILDEESRSEIAWQVAKESSYSLVRNIKNFAILNESERIRLAKFVAEKEPAVLSRHIQNFDIPNEKDRIEIAYKVAEEDSSSLVQNFKNFGISNENEKIKLIKIIAEKVPTVFINNIQNFEISDDGAKIEVDKIIAEKYRETLTNNIQNAIANEKARIKLAQTVAEEQPALLVENFQNFLISDENAKIGLAQLLIRKHLSTSLIDNGYFEKLQISNPSVRANLYASAYLGLIAKGEMRATNEALINQFFRHDPESMSLAQVAAQFGNRHSVIADLLKAPEQEPDPHTREILFTWTQLVSLRFAADQLRETAWQELKAPLEAIQEWRAPTMRYVLTHLLAQQCLSPEAKDVNGFFAFCKRFTKARTHLYPALLFPLFQSATNDPTLEKLVTLLHQREFKDVERQKSMVNALVALVQAERLPDNLKRLLLQTALPKGSDHEVARSLAKTAPLMECLVSFAQHSPERENVVLQRLQSIRNPGDFNEQMNNVFKDLFPDLSNAPNAVDQFNRYRKHARHATGLITYTMKMRNHRNDDEKASVLAAIGEFVKATVLSSNPEHTFRQLRYDLAKSDHLRRVAEKAPEAFAHWKQSFIFVYERSAAFLAQATPSSRQDAKHFTVIDTDAAEDLFLCSTEVAGSCQSIQNEPHNNKTLMGYVLDGKYRLLAIKSEVGRLMGRRILRLLWDEQAQRPVLHLEPLYHNPGIPKRYEQALIELARQKAKQMKCALVSHDKKLLLESSGFYPAPLIAYPTPWPFESVETKIPMVLAGKEGYQLSEARIVGSLH